MPKIVWNSFNNGLSDNTISGGKGQFTDCRNIDIKSNPLAVKVGEGKVITRNLPYGNYGNVRKISQTGQYSYVILSSLGAYKQDGTNITQFNDDIYNHIFIQGQVTDSADINFSSKNYFFSQGKIYKMNWDFTSLEKTINHTPLAPVSSCIRVAHTVLFSKVNSIYQLDTLTDTIKEIVTSIPYEYSIIGMSFFNDELTVITRFHGGTKIFRLLYNSGLYDIVYSHTIRGEYANSMTTENEVIYWLTDKSLFITSGGQSQRFKNIGGEVIGFYGNKLVISSFGSTYMYEPTYIGGQRVLVNILNNDFRDVCGNFFLGNQELYTLAGSNGYDAYIISNTFFENPSVEKEITEINIAYKMEYTKNQQIDRKMGMEIWLTHDEDGNSEWIKITDITDENTREKTISAQEIKKAFDAVGKKHTFFVLKAKIVMKSGGKKAYQNIFHNTPVFYQMEINYNPINYARH